MSTRCNVRIEYGETRTWLYRHWDGYPEATGADIASKLQSSLSSATGLMRELLSAGEVTRLRGMEHDYEVTNGVHGDIEHVYVVRFDLDAGGVTVEHLERPNFESEPSGAPVLRSKFKGIIPEYVDYINKLIKHANAVARKRSGTGPDFAEVVRL